MSSRRAGTVSHPIGHHICDHVCWTYADGRSSWIAAAIPFLLDGAPRGERLLYLADADRAGLLTDLDGLDGRDRLLATGQLLVMPLSEVNGPAGRFDPASGLAAFRRWAQEAVAAGYPALRVATDASSLIGNRSDVAAFVGFELLLDTMVTTAPMVVMCGYDRRRLSTDTIAQMCFVHPLTHDPATVVGVHADGNDGWNVVGPLDFTCAGHLTAVLSALPDTGDVHLHLDRLRFSDAAATRALLVKAAAMHPRGRLVLHEPPDLLRKVLDIGWPGDSPGLILLPP